MPNPTITITVTEFKFNPNMRPIGPYCTIGNIALSNVNGGAAAPQIGFLPNSTTDVGIQSPDFSGNPGNQPVPVTFDIVIVSSPLPGAQPFNLTIDQGKKIRFSQTNGNGDGNGNRNFPGIVVNGATLTITDKCLDRGKKNNNAPRWKYSIGVIDSNSGQPGWIDPQMENVDDL